VRTIDKSYLFIDACLNEWQSVDDLMFILQSSSKTAWRYINTFRLMCKTFEITKYILEERYESQGYREGTIIQVRILIK